VNSPDAITAMFVANLKRLTFALRVLCCATLLVEDLYQTFTAGFDFGIASSLVGIAVAATGMAATSGNRGWIMRTRWWMPLELAVGPLVLLSQPDSVLAMIHFCFTMFDVSSSRKRYIPWSVTVLLLGSMAAHVVILNYFHPGELTYVILRKLLVMVIIGGCFVLGRRVNALVLTANSAWSRLVSEERAHSQLEERLSLAEGLHDSVTKSIYGSYMLAETLDDELQKEGGPNAKTSALLKQSLAEAQEEARTMVHSLRGA
jgi:signal transduction histidine kinase